MGQHRTIGHTVNFTHELYIEAERFAFRFCLGFLVLGQGNQGIHGVHLLSACFDTSHDSRLIFLGRSTLKRTNQGIYSSLKHFGFLCGLCVLRLGIEHLGNGLERSHIPLLVCLDAKTFTDTQEEAIHHVFVRTLDCGVPVSTGQHPTMDLTGLRVDDTIDAYSLLLPDRVSQIQRLL